MVNTENLSVCLCIYLFIYLLTEYLFINSRICLLTLERPEHDSNTLSNAHVGTHVGAE